MFLLTAAVILALPSAGPAGQSPDAFITAFQKALESKDLASYPSFFVPEIQQSERSALLFNLDDAAFYSVRTRKAGEKTDASGIRRVVLQVLFQNSYSAVVEIWQLDIAQVDDRWLIKAIPMAGLWPPF